MEKRERLRQFLTGILLRRGDASPLRDDDSLVISGRIDSMAILEIIGFLESDFGFEVSEDMFSQSHFDSIDRILLLTGE